VGGTRRKHTYLKWGKGTVYALEKVSFGQRESATPSGKGTSKESIDLEKKRANGNY